MPADRLQVVLIGAGRMGRRHLAALADCPAVELAAIVDPAARVRNEFEADDGPRYYASVAELLAARRPIDAAVIAAPSGEHLRLIRELAAAGIHILCEKPCGVTVDDARAAAAAAQAGGVVLQVAYWRRFVPELRVLRDRIARGELGEIGQLSCYQWDHEPPPPAFRHANGGIAIDMGVHEFDQIRWLLGGEIGTITVSSSQADEDARDPDAACVVGTVAGSTIVTVSLGRHFPAYDCCWVEVLGRQAHDRILFAWAESSDDSLHRALVEQLTAFVDAVRGGPLLGATPEDAIAALGVAEQVDRALAGNGSL